MYQIDEVTEKGKGQVWVRKVWGRDKSLVIAPTVNANIFAKIPCIEATLENLRFLSRGWSE